VGLARQPLGHSLRLTGDPEAEIFRQLERFRALLGRDPTHIDSHQHVHRRKPMRTPMAALAQELGVPARELAGGVRYCGGFYGQGPTGGPHPDGITVERLLALLSALPRGMTELACHPGYGDDIESMYRTERTRELEALCDPRVRAHLDALGIELCSFAALT
jgi:predicted glycoside hydrolase/deacetylase ChbG (UPF0249 family)